MQEGVQLKYGHVMGGKTSVPVTMAASQVIVAASGRFVYMNDGAATIVTAASTTIFGFLETEADAVTAAEIRNCIIDLTAIFRIPIDTGTYVIGMVGDQCDLAISSNIQGAELEISTRLSIIIVGGDADNSNWVDVMMNDDIWGTGLGTDE